LGGVEQGDRLSHRLPYPLAWGHGSVAIFAEQPANRLVIFIHGFGGKAVKTWSGMHELLEYPKASGSDVLFYGYGSLSAPARNSATLFRELVDAAASNALPWQHALREAGAVGGTRDYSDILIVAHSLGAVVTRRALLDAIRAQHPWVDKVRLLLFGPAHMGARLLELKALLRSSISAIIADLFTIAQMRAPVLDDLSEGSQFLADLLSESEQQIAAGRGRALVAERVIFGERDYVVRTDPFASDPLSVVWADEDHTSVCRVPQTPSEVARLL
jgi:hypothetical protein